MNNKNLLELFCIDGFMTFICERYEIAFKALKEYKYSLQFEFRPYMLALFYLIIFSCTSQEWCYYSPQKT